MNKTFGRSILSIAGSDSGGGAGIQADIKTATALKTYAATSITCITAQNTVKVREVVFLPSQIIADQINAVLDDLRIGAIKTGMLGSAEIVSTVIRTLQNKAAKIPLIVDPVMVATSNDKLITDEGIKTIKTKLLPLAYLITPNIPEAEILAEMTIKNLADMKIAAKKIMALGAQNVLIKGGHLPNQDYRIQNLLVTKKTEIIISNRIVTQQNIHGTGCTLSAAITCFLAQKYDLVESVKRANQYVYRSIKKGGKIGGGSRVLQHF